MGADMTADNMRAHYWRSCTEWPAAEVDELIAMQERARPITWATIKRRVDRASLVELVAALGYGRLGLRIEADPCVQCYTSRYFGERVYYVQHSRIEHVFRRPVPRHWCRDAQRSAAYFPARRCARRDPQTGTGAALARAVVTA